ncbi:hypothetical protein LTR08_003125 [Meristemomyces frigidus]|nr:hypothetical protein LTR08_003125 [Meristemomyces frigidus]
MSYRLRSNRPRSSLQHGPNKPDAEVECDDIAEGVGITDAQTQVSAYVSTAAGRDVELQAEIEAKTPLYDQSPEEIADGLPRQWYMSMRRGKGEREGEASDKNAKGKSKQQSKVTKQPKSKVKQQPKRKAKPRIRTIFSRKRGDRKDDEGPNGGGGQDSGATGGMLAGPGAATALEV